MIEASSAKSLRRLSEALVGYGYTPVRAELWSRLVEEICVILDSAAAELRTPAAWTAFSQKRGSFGVTKVKIRRKVTVQAPLEDAITAELGHIARRLRAALPAGHLLRVHEVAFATEHLVESNTRTGRHSRKVDFFIYAQTDGTSPELAIEAKPLQSPSDVESRYLAEEGIGCFFAPDTAYTDQPLAGMLAYTINGSGRSSGEDIRKGVAAMLPAPLAMELVAVSRSTPGSLCSRHDRSSITLDPVAILHLEMIFAPLEVALIEGDGLPAEV